MSRADILIPLLVGLGGAVGSIGRYLSSGLVARAFGESFPWGTLSVNIIGSILIGLIATITGPEGRFLWTAEARQFVMVGVFGGFTTFSSFSLQTLSLLQDGEWLYAAGNIVLSVGLCLLGVWLGWAAGTMINR